MKSAKWIVPSLALCMMLSAAIPAAAWLRNPALTFVVLPEGATGPEGLTVGPNGDIYVATFGFNAAGAVTGSGQLYVYSPQGKLLRQVTIANSSPHLLGLAFHPNGSLLVIDFGGAQVLKVDPVTGSSSVFLTPLNPSSAGLNALTFDKAGNVYVSDSFQGVIWTSGPSGATPAKAWASDPLLTTAGVPPFGANGIEFNHSGTALFVANTGDDRVLKISVNAADGSAGDVSVFTNSINGADGIAFDQHDNLWVAANQEDEIVVVNTKGKVIAKLGDFYGVDDGVPRGLLFPASLAFSADGRWLYVTNLVLDLRIFNKDLYNAIDSDWTAVVKRYTVSRISAHIPPLRPGGDEE